MEIQCGKERMKAAEFNNTIGATTDCTVRLLLNIIPVEQQGAKHGVRGDTWFGSINTANKVGSKGLKESSKLSSFTPYFLKNTLRRH
jgi:hypothetical protein